MTYLPLLAVGLAAGWNIANTGAAAGTLSSAYGVSLPTIGLLTTALFLTHFGSQVPGGILIDRFGPRPVGFAALSVIAVGNAIALAFASFPLAVATAAGQAQDPGRLVGRLYAANTLGAIVGSLVSISEHGLGYLLALYVGFFLFIGATDLLPEAHHHGHPSRLRVALTVVGFVATFGIAYAARL